MRGQARGRARGWSLAARVARRELRARPWSTAIAVVVVALPVALGVAGAQLAHNTAGSTEQQARSEMGAADAYLEVTGRRAVTPAYRGDTLVGRPAGARRDPGKVDLADLLPGATLTPAPRYGTAELSAGGTASVLAVDAASPLIEGIVDLASGRAPENPDEAAVPGALAQELGLLDGGELVPSARIRLADGTGLRVVGILGDRAAFGSAVGGARLLVAPATSLPLDATPTGYLAALGDAGPATPALAAGLAAAGVLMKPRDVYAHPQAWGAPTPGRGDRDATASAVGAVVVGGGSLIIVVVIGALFLVGAQRRVRELGLLAASGADARALRRLVLAEGGLLGGAGAIVGVAGGLVLFRLGLPAYEAVSDKTVWTRQHDLASVAVVASLGVAAAVAAAWLPARRVGRIEVVQALRGEFARPSRRSLEIGRRTGLGLAAVGAVGLALAGHLAAQLARDVGAAAPGGRGPGLALVGAALAATALAVGLTLLFPGALQTLAGRVGSLPLAPRFALRDTARSPARTAATGAAVLATVAAAVVGLFATESATQRHQVAGTLPAHALRVTFDGAGPGAVGRATAAVASVLGEVGDPHQIATPARRDHPAALALLGGPDGPQEIAVVDDADFRYLLEASEVPSAAANIAARTLAGGGLVVLDSAAPGPVARAGDARLGLFPGPGRPGRQWSLPGASVEAPRAAADLGRAWISIETARRLGFDTLPQVAIYQAGRAVTATDIERLQVHGIVANSPDIASSKLILIRRSALVAVGLVTIALVGLAVALTLGEVRAELATAAAVGAEPRTLRATSSALGGALAGYGTLLGLAAGLPAAIALVQADGLRGTVVPWAGVGMLAVGVPLLGLAVGLAVSPRGLLAQRERRT